MPLIKNLLNARFKRSESGAVPRPINEVLGDTVDARDFGVIADSSGSTQAAANRAGIKAAIVAAGSGGTVHLPPGVIYMDQALDLTSSHSGCRLIGKGIQKTILRNHLYNGDYGPNNSLWIRGEGVGYYDFMTATPSVGAGTITLAGTTADGIPFSYSHYPVGAAIYLFKGGLPATPVWERFEITAINTGTGVVTLDHNVTFAGMDRIKWVNGRAIGVVAAGEAFVTVETLGHATFFQVGDDVLVTAGPQYGNEIAPSEWHVVTDVDAITGVISLDSAVTIPIPADQGALVRMTPVKHVEIRDLTVDLPVGGSGVSIAFFKFCRDLTFENVWFVDKDNPQDTTGTVPPTTSAFLTFRNCRVLQDLTLNSSHDVVVTGGVYGQIGCEESAIRVRVQHLVIARSDAQNGLAITFHSHTWYVDDVQIYGFTQFPLYAEPGCGDNSRFSRILVQGDPAETSRLIILEGANLSIVDLRSDCNIIIAGAEHCSLDLIRAPKITGYHDNPVGTTTSGTISNSYLTDQFQDDTPTKAWRLIGVYQGTPNTTSNVLPLGTAAINKAAVDSGYVLDAFGNAKIGNNASNNTLIGANGNIGFVGASTSGWGFGISHNQGSNFPILMNASGYLAIGESATYIQRVMIYTPTLTVAQIGASTSVEQTFTEITGLETTDTVFVVKPTVNAGVSVASARVSASGSLTITFVNASTSPVTPTASEVYRVFAIRS